LPDAEPPFRDIIAVGASAGGVEALIRLVGGLPPDLPASVLVVIHLAADSRSALPSILSRSGALPAVHPEDGAPLLPGQIYVAPPDRHLLVEEDHVRIFRGPRENRHRPAVDPLFRSAARCCGSRVIGIVLTGSRDDGAAGLAAIKRAGGIAVVQDPKDAMVPSMPATALEHVDVDYCLPLRKIPDLLIRLCRREGASPTVNDRETQEEPAMGPQERRTPLAGPQEVEMGPSTPSSEPWGAATGVGCPECGGSLWEVREGSLLRYQCRVGHAYTADTLLRAQSDVLESALWAALNTLRESAALHHRLAHNALERGHHLTAERLETRGVEQEGHAEILRQLLTGDSAADASLHEHGNGDGTDGDGADADEESASAASHAREAGRN
jgi:two-component system chemotaxis response regulator CheB